jgi:TAT (twin-arginine translocation) pathway-exported protein
MKDLHVTRRQILKGAGAAGVAGVLGAPVAAFADGAEGEGHGRVRWDLIQIVSGCVNPGGTSSAQAEGATTIMMTGSGTFPNVRNRCVRGVTGGGTWTVSSDDPRCLPGSGHYRVTELLGWTTAPGGSFPPFEDCIPGGTKATATAGLALLRIKYDDGKSGILTVDCHLPGSPDCMFEGITATREYVDFSHWLGGPTVFHFLGKGKD